MPTPDAIRAALWNETEYKYHEGAGAPDEGRVQPPGQGRGRGPVERLLRRARHTSTQNPRGARRSTRRTWSGVLSRVGDYLAEHDFVQTSSAGISLTDRNSYMVNSEGSALQHGNTYIRLHLAISGMADDGMDLHRGEVLRAPPTRPTSRTRPRSWRTPSGSSPNSPRSGTRRWSSPTSARPSS